MVNQGSRRSLSVAPRDANHFGIGVTSGKFDFRNNRDARFPDLHHHRRVFGNARTLHHLVRSQDFRFRVPAILPGDAITVEHVHITGLDFPGIGNKHLETFLQGQHRSTHAALRRP